MKTVDMNYRFEPRDPSRRIKGLAIVVALHVFLGYALISGMARNGLNMLKKPLEAVVIQEVIIPPPPPPPPKEIKEPKPEAPKVEAPPPFVPPPEVVAPVSTTAPTIEARATPPATAPVIAPPATGPVRREIGAVCPTQVPPDMPRKAIQDGTEGVVRAQVIIKDGSVRDVSILSGPRVFHAAVRAAMLQYKCNASASEVVATQEFVFKLE